MSTNNIDMAAFVIGSTSPEIMVVADVWDGPDRTREAVVLLTGDTARIQTWGWAIQTMREVTDVRGPALVLACRMFVEQECSDEVRLAT